MNRVKSVRYWKETWTGRRQFGFVATRYNACLYFNHFIFRIWWLP